MLLVYQQGKTYRCSKKPTWSDQNSKDLTEDEKVKFKAWKKEATAVYEENVRLEI